MRQQIAGQRARFDEKDGIISSQQQLLNSKFALRQPVVVGGSAHAALLWNWTRIGTKDEGAGIVSTTFSIYPNQKVAAPVRLEITFTGNLVKAPEFSMPAASFLSTGDGAIVGGGIQIVVPILSPALEPELPLVVKVYGANDLNVLRVKCLNCPE